MFKRIIKKMFSLLPKRRVILFESCPDLSDNARPVFDEMIKRGLNKKYKFIWLCYEKPLASYPKIKNVNYLFVPEHRKKAAYLSHRVRVVICCNRFVGSDIKGQKCFYLCHGTPLKDASEYYNAPQYVDYVVGTSDYLRPILANQLKISESKIFVLGFPRTDTFFDSKIDLSVLFDTKNKIIAWYPTVKTFKRGRKTGSIKPIQFLWDDGLASQINDFAKNNNITIVVKPHFAQLTSEIKQSSFSNIVFINDDFFKNNNITSYQFLRACDALLTDYSSIYSDYLLCDKPIGLIWEDIEEYSKNPGLVKEYQFICSGGRKIFSVDDLCQFIKEVNDDNDTMKDQRRSVLPNIHQYNDGQSTNRVVSFVMDNLGKK